MHTLHCGLVGGLKSRLLMLGSPSIKDCNSLLDIRMIAIFLITADADFYQSQALSKAVSTFRKNTEFKISIALNVI